jgi:small-conductance mechanosensitive channel
LKLNTRTITYLSLFVFLVVVAILYFNYSKQQNILQDERQNLTSAKANITKLNSDKTNLDAQLVQVNGQTAKLQSQLLLIQQSLIQKKQILPESINSVNYGIILFDTAQRFNIDILSISTSGPQDNKVGNITFSNITFSLSLQGNLEDLQGLVHTFATEDPFRTAIIETSNLNRVEDTITKTPQAGGTTPVTISNVYHTMDLEINLYCSKGG